MAHNQQSSKTLSAPNPISTIYKKILFIEGETGENKLKFTHSTNLYDMEIVELSNDFIFDGSTVSITGTLSGTTPASGSATVTGDVSQLFSDIYSGAAASGLGYAGHYLSQVGDAWVGSTSSNVGIVGTLELERTQRIATDAEINTNQEGIEKLLGDGSTAWPYGFYTNDDSQHNVFNKFDWGYVTSDLYPMPNFLSATAGVFDALAKIDTQMQEHNMFIQGLYNVLNLSGTATAGQPYAATNTLAGQTWVGSPQTLYSIGDPTSANTAYLSSGINLRKDRPGSANLTDDKEVSGSAVKSLELLDLELERQEIWGNKLSTYLDDNLNLNAADASGGAMAWVHNDDTWQALNNVDVGSDQTYTRTYAGADSVSMFQALKNMDIWMRYLERKIDRNYENGLTLVGDVADNTNRRSLTELKADVNALCSEIGLTGADAAVPVYTSPAGTYLGNNVVKDDIDELDAQLKHVTEGLFNTDVAATAWDTAKSDEIYGSSAMTDIQGLRYVLGTMQSNIGLTSADTVTSDGVYASPGGTYTTGNDVVKTDIADLEAQLEFVTQMITGASTGGLQYTTSGTTGTDIETNVNNIQSELDVVETHTGLAADGTYTSPSGTYLGNASIKADVDELDAQLASVTNMVTGSTTAGAEYTSHVGALNVEADIEKLHDLSISDTWSHKNRLDKIVNAGDGDLLAAEILDMANFKIERLGAGSASTDAATYGQLTSLAAGLIPGYRAKVATQQQADATTLMADSPSQSGADPVGGLMAIDTSQTLAMYNAPTSRTWANKGNIDLTDYTDGTVEYEHGGIAYDDTTKAPKTITANDVYIDGILVETGDLVLVTGEAIAKVDGVTWNEGVEDETAWHWRNGIWIFNESGDNSGVWERPGSDILWEAGSEVTVGQCHPIGQGYYNGLSVFMSVAATIGSGEPTYPIEACETEAQAETAALGNDVVSAWAIFTNIQAIGSGNVTTLQNYNEIHLDYNEDIFEVTSGSPDYLDIKFLPYTSAYVDGSTDLIPFEVNASGIGLQVDNNTFGWDTGSGVNRLTLKDTQPIIGQNMNLDAGGLTFNLAGHAGEVGIGTSAPDALLEVAGGSGGYGEIIVSSDSASNIQLFDNDARIGGMNTQSGKFNLFAGTNEWAQHLTILSSGKVGIGYSSPMDMFHVKSAEGETGSILLESWGSEADDHPRLRLARAKSTGDLAVDDGHSLGSIEFLGYMGDQGDYYTNYESGAIITAVVDGEPSNSNEDMPCELQFWTRDDGGVSLAQNMTIRGDGSVGIGTTNPGNPLSVAFSSTGTTQASFTGIDIANTDSTADNGACISFGRTGVASNSSTRIGAIHEDRTGASEDTHLFFGTVGDGGYAERMRIDSEGNVGIGTEDPEVLLTVGTLENSGTVKGNLAVKAISGDHAINIEEYDGSENWSLGVSSAGDFGFYDGGGATASIVIQDNTGYVGIDNGDPGQPLTIGHRGTADSEGMIRVETNNAAGGSRGWDFGVSSTPGTYNLGFTIQDNDMAAPAFYIAHTSGNVGIGTTSSDAKVEIAGNGGNLTGDISLSQSLLNLHNPLEADTLEKGSILSFSDMYFDDPDYVKTTRAAIKGGTDEVGNTANGFLAFYTDSSASNSITERMRIDHDGHVGIGITAPPKQVTIAGANTAGVLALVNTDANNAIDDGTGLGEIYFGGDDPTDNTYQYGAIIKAEASDGWSGTADSPSELQFWTAKNGATTTQSMVIQEGNVGIGIGSPSELLHVSKNHNAATALQISNTTEGTGGMAQLEITSAVGSGLIKVHGAEYSAVDSWKNSMVIQADTPLDGGLVLYSSDKIRFTNTIGTPHVTILDGNVGVGKTVPTAILHIDQDANNIGLQLEHAGTTAQAAYLSGTQTTGSLLDVRADSLTTGYGLHVHSNSTAFESTNGLLRVQVDDDTTASGTALYVGQDGTGDIIMAKDGSNVAFVVEDGGQVGIGTASPQAKLDVAGTIRVNNNDSIESIGSISIDIDTDNNATDRFFAVCANNDLSEPLFRVQENGNVGINWAAPTSYLQIAGDTDEAVVDMIRLTYESNTEAPLSHSISAQHNGELSTGAISNKMVFKVWNPDDAAGKTALTLLGDGTASFASTVNGRTIATDGNTLDTIAGYFTSNTYSAIGAHKAGGDVGVDFLTSKLKTNMICCASSPQNQLVLNAGESEAISTSEGGQTSEYVYVNAESGLQINSSSDNWGNGTELTNPEIWANRYSAYICDHNGKTTLPGLLNVYGDVVAYYSSDSRLKDNQSNIANPLEKLSKLNGIEFDWNDKQDVHTGHDVGVIAQEVEEVLPEIVTTRERDGYKAVKYDKIVPLLIEAIKAQQVQIDELKAKLA